MEEEKQGRREEEEILCDGKRKRVQIWQPSESVRGGVMEKCLSWSIDDEEKWQEEETDLNEDGANV